MRRNWNWLVWAGFGVGLFATFSYVPIFARFATTRDFPWANLLLFLAALGMLAKGLQRAFRDAERYRGKVSGRVLGGVTLVLFGLFCLGIYLAARSLPSSATALRAGRVAPEFRLADVDGKMVTLSELRAGERGVLLIFYRGYW